MISLSEENNLIIDYTQLVGHSCVVTFTSWESGILWTNILEKNRTVHTNFLDDPSLSLSIVHDSPEACQWVDKIPKDLIGKLLDYERIYHTSIYSLLCLLNRYQSAIDLFISNPLLMAIVMHSAKENKWSEETTANLLLEKRIKILEACGFSGDKSTLKIINKLSYRSFTLQKYHLMQTILALPNKHLLNHLPYIDFNLFRLLTSHPQLLSSRLLHSYQAEWPILKFKMLYADIGRMADNEQGDTEQKLLNSRTIDELEAMHDRYTERLNARRYNIDEIEDINYPVAPIAGTENIIPITNSKELLREGRKQHHCVASYHHGIVARRSYIYKVIAPERATLEIRIQSSGHHLGQVKLAYNKMPSKETFESIYAWMES
ncbi:MAG TPA: hypothetical protein ENJ51_09980 [Leucothrix mucor]|uniref:PcfJ-like protein n=1 Tax=Leucothrix mucor TaxID=45248 RepID=A0A7V2WVY3_LEUMU|nr:hypothetical protein [Leucothrix mucor]